MNRFTSAKNKRKTLIRRKRKLNKFLKLLKYYPILSSIIILFLTLIITTCIVMAVANFEFLEIKSKNELGDAMGGIANPIIAFVGVFVTFLAFYIQYKANKQQREMFNEGLINERKRIKALEEKELEMQIQNYKTHKEVFKILGLKLINQYKSSGRAIADFCKNEMSNRYKVNSIKTNISVDYEYFKKIDFITLHKSISFFAKDDKDWQSHFMNAISIIEYYEAYINGLTNSIKEKNIEKRQKLKKILEDFKKIYEINQSKYSFLIQKELVEFENKNNTSVNFLTFSKDFLDPVLVKFNNYENTDKDHKFEEFHNFLLGLSTDLDSVYAVSDIFLNDCIKKHAKYFIEKKLLDEAKDYLNKIN